MNPLLALLRRGSNNSRTYNKKQVSALGKSASSAEHLDKTGGFEVLGGGGGVAHPKALLSKTLGRGLSLGKKHALKKYDQFVQNTSCFCTMCDFHNFGLIYVGECTVCLKG